jgi:hypothetical protein
MRAIRHGVRKRMVVCAGLALTAAFAVLAVGCGNPGEGTVHVDPRVAARLGKHLGVPPAAYGKTKVEPIGIKSRLRTDAAPKQRRLGAGPK